MSGFFVGIVTILAIVTFFGIVWWAWSARRAEDNRKASMLPFDLPEEYNDKSPENSEKRTGGKDE